MKTIIISDLHLGNDYCQSSKLIRFLGNLEPGTTLVLNGDTTSKWDKKLPEQHMEALSLIKKEAERRKVIWIYGNHDDEYVPENCANIEFVDSYVIDNHIYIAHGDKFDHLRKALRPLTGPLYLLHRLRLHLGATPIHVSGFVKSLTFLYRPYKSHFANVVMNYAKKNKYDTIICGHIHDNEEVRSNGIHYLNTGSWTEQDNYYISINNDEIQLKEVKFE